MNFNLPELVNYMAQIAEALGAIIIALGVVLALIRFVFGWQPKKKRSYLIMRNEIGRSILLGLEILIAADIMASINTAPQMEDVLVLAVIVLIRTFLSFSLQIEIEEKFPWQRNKTKAVGGEP